MPISAKQLFQLSKLQPFGIASTGLDKAKNLSRELYGYDFINLIVKLVLYFAIAWVIEKYIWWTQDKPINRFLATAFGSIGGLPLFALSQQILHYFDSPQVNQGIKYWDIVKSGAVGLVVWEYYNYYKSQENLGGKVSPMTTGVFALIGGALGLAAIPDLWKKITEMYQQGGGGQSNGNGAGR